MEDATEFIQLGADKQTRLDTLMTNNNNGRLSDMEKQELQTLVREVEEITIANARLLTTQCSHPNLSRPEAGVRAA